MYFFRLQQQKGYSRKLSWTILFTNMIWLRDTNQTQWDNAYIHLIWKCGIPEAPYIIGIDTKVEVIVVSQNDQGSSPQPEGCGELTRSLVTPQWPKSRYQFLFYHDASNHIKFMQIRVCIGRKSLIKLLQTSHYGRLGHRPLSHSLLSYVLVTIVMSQWLPVSLNLDSMPHWKTS